jgi:hypothetical protein
LGRAIFCFEFWATIIFDYIRTPGALEQGEAAFCLSKFTRHLNGMTDFRETVQSSIWDQAIVVFLDKNGIFLPVSKKNASVGIRSTLSESILAIFSKCWRFHKSKIQGQGQYNIYLHMDDKCAIWQFNLLEELQWAHPPPPPDDIDSSTAAVLQTTGVLLKKAESTFKDCEPQLFEWSPPKDALPMMMKTKDDQFVPLPSQKDQALNCLEMGLKLNIDKSKRGWSRVYLENVFGSESDTSKTPGVSTPEKPNARKRLIYSKYFKDDHSEDQDDSYLMEQQHQHEYQEKDHNPSVKQPRFSSLFEPMEVAKTDNTISIAALSAEVASLKSALTDAMFIIQHLQKQGENMTNELQVMKAMLATDSAVQLAKTSEMHALVTQIAQSFLQNKVDGKTEPKNPLPLNSKEAKEPKASSKSQRAPYPTKSPVDIDFVLKEFKTETMTAILYIVNPLEDQKSVLLEPKLLVSNQDVRKEVDSLKKGEKKGFILFTLENLKDIQNFDWFLGASHRFSSYLVYLAPNTRYHTLQYADTV